MSRFIWCFVLLISFGTLFAEDEPKKKRVAAAIGECAEEENEIAERRDDGPTLYERNRRDVLRDRRLALERWYRNHPEGRCRNCWKLPAGLDYYPPPPSKE